MNHRITFPCRVPGGPSYSVDVKAPSHALAQRVALERAAASGIELRHLNLHFVPDLQGAVLDGLRLTNCGLSRVSFVGASLKTAAFTDCLFDHIEADQTTDMSGAVLERVDIDCSRFAGVNLRGANITGLRMFQTDALGLDLTGATVHTLKMRMGVSSGWKLLDCYLTSVDDLRGLVASSAHTENEKSAILALACDGNRAKATKWLEQLNAQEA